MVGYDVGLEMENVLDLNLSIRPWSNVVGRIWGCITTLGPRAWYKNEGRMDRHMYKFCLRKSLWSSIPNYKLDPRRLVFQRDNDSKHTYKNMQEWFLSQAFRLLQWHAQSPGLNPIEIFGHFSNGAWTNLRHLQRVSKTCGSICVQCITILMNKVAWRFMIACYKELMLCWRVGITRPITKVFVGNLNKTE